MEEKTWWIERDGMIQRVIFVQRSCKARSEIGSYLLTHILDPVSHHVVLSVVVNQSDSLMKRLRRFQIPDHGN